jgi:hypothetical protein
LSGGRSLKGLVDVTGAAGVDTSAAGKAPDCQFLQVREVMMCCHIPRCPSSDAPHAEFASVVVEHPEQGWSKLCNGLILFDDQGYLRPDGRSVPPEVTGQRQVLVGVA